MQMRCKRMHTEKRDRLTNKEREKREKKETGTDRQTWRETPSAGTDRQTARHYPVSLLSITFT